MNWVVIGLIAVLLILVIAAIIQVWVKRQERKQQRKRIRQSLPDFPTAYHRITLASDVDADYTKLRDLLSEQNYQDADQETYQIVLWVARREKKGWLRHTDIDDFPSTDLRTIDQLWVHYSSGRFGFSVQKRIYQELGGTRKYDETIWQRFGDQIGWRVNGNWLSYAQLIFENDAPEGHLPAAGGIWVGVVPRVVGWGCGRYLISREDL